MVFSMQSCIVEYHNSVSQQTSELANVGEFFFNWYSYLEHLLKTFPTKWASLVVVVRGRLTGIVW